MDSNEPLKYLNPDKWEELQKTFELNWPKNIPGYYILEIQKSWIDLGLDYGFKVFCPYGEVENGMVAVNEKGGFYEIVIQCGNEDTSMLEEALINTKLIDWGRKITVPYAPLHVVRCLEQVLSKIGTAFRYIHFCNSFIIKKDSTPFANTSLPINIKFDKLKEEDVKIVNDSWPYKHSTSAWYFTKLIKAGVGYGIYEDSKLAAWVLVNEGGSLCNLFTLENYRRKGYAEVLMKKVCNDLLAKGKDTFAFSVYGNEEACKLYRKLGFEEFDDVAFGFVKPIE